MNSNEPTPDFHQLKALETIFQKRKRRAKQWALVVSAGFVGEVLIKLAMRHGTTGISRPNLEQLAFASKAIGVASLFYLWLRVWRCPACDSRLGVTKLPWRKVHRTRFCPYCEVPLEFSDDPEVTKLALQRLSSPGVREALDRSKGTRQSS